MNLLITGYLRPPRAQSNELYNEWILPMDILSIIENLAFEDWNDKHISDEDAQKLCDDIGGYKYMTCSAFEGLNFDGSLADWYPYDHPMDTDIVPAVNEIFEEVCRCWEHNQNKKTRKKSCNIL